MTDSLVRMLDGPDELIAALAAEVVTLRSIVRKVKAGGHRPDDTHWLMTGAGPVGITADEAALLDAITEEPADGR